MASIRQPLDGEYGDDDETYGERERKRN